MIKLHSSSRRLAIYIHWPYCVSKCPYCDFNSGRMPSCVDEARWVEAYLAEIKYYAGLLPDCEIGSIYFGGGTPSLMAVKTVDAVLRGIEKYWRVLTDAEITLEANPSSVEAEKFAGFRDAGINRLSLGVQSLRDDGLAFLGRAHNVAEAKAAIELAAKYFPRYSFDLIYARRDQTLIDWEKELREALCFGAKHMSLYQLTVEPNTQFYKLSLQGKTFVAQDEVAAETYERTLEIMNDAKIPQYEISNFAAEGEESRHNMTYWKYEDYIGIGPSAHGRVVIDGKRFATENHRDAKSWMKQVFGDGNGLSEFYEIDLATAQREVVMMGLRLVSGIDLEAWRGKFGWDIYGFLSVERAFRLRKEGLLGDSKAAFCVTKEGLQRLDSVLKYLFA